MSLDLPERLLNVQVVADEARKHHSLEDVLVAAGMPRPRRVDREAIVARLIVRRGLIDSEQIQRLRDDVNQVLDAAEECRS